MRPVPGSRQCKIPREPPAPRRRAPFKPQRALGHSGPPAAASSKPSVKTFLPDGKEFPSLRIFCCLGPVYWPLWPVSPLAEKDVPSCRHAPRAPPQGATRATPTRPALQTHTPVTPTPPTRQPGGRRCARRRAGADRGAEGEEGRAAPRGARARRTAAYAAGLVITHSLHPMGAGVGARGRGWGVRGA